VVNSKRGAQMEYELLRQYAAAALRSAYPDPAAWAERDTDAGTFDPYAPSHPDNDAEPDDSPMDAVIVWAAVGTGFWLCFMAFVGWLA
jgi:hypothetical protein